MRFFLLAALVLSSSMVIAGDLINVKKPFPLEINDEFQLGTYRYIGTVSQAIISDDKQVLTLKGHYYTSHWEIKLDYPGDSKDWDFSLIEEVLKGQHKRNVTLIQISRELSDGQHSFSIHFDNISSLYNVLATNIPPLNEITQSDDVRCQTMGTLKYFKNKQEVKEEKLPLAKIVNQYMARGDNDVNVKISDRFADIETSRYELSLFKNQLTLQYIYNDKLLSSFENLNENISVREAYSGRRIQLKENGVLLVKESDEEIRSGQIAKLTSQIEKNQDEMGQLTKKLRRIKNWFNFSEMKIVREKKRALRRTLTANRLELKKIQSTDIVVKSTRLVELNLSCKTN